MLLILSASQLVLYKATDSVDCIDFLLFKPPFILFIFHSRTFLLVNTQHFLCLTFLSIKQHSKPIHIYFLFLLTKVTLPHIYNQTSTCKLSQLLTLLILFASHLVHRAATYSKQFSYIYIFFLLHFRSQFPFSIKTHFPFKTFPPCSSHNFACSSCLR